MSIEKRDMKIKSLLVVDDEDSIHHTISLVLDEENISIDSAYDGKMALKKTQVQTYDLIISDINMPQMNGVSFLEKFKETDDGTPVLVFAADFREDYRERLAKIDVTEMVTKPIDDIVEFKDRILTLLYSCTVPA